MRPTTSGSARNLAGEARPLLRIENDLGKLPVEIAAVEGRALLGQHLEDPRRATGADRPAQFAFLGTAITLGRKIDDLSRDRLTVGFELFPFGVTRLGGPVAVAEIGRLATALHAGSDRPEMYRGFAIDALIGVAAAVDADVESGVLKRAIADPFPHQPDGLDLARAGFEIVELAGLGAESVRANSPRRHQEMRVIIPLVAVAIGRVDGEVDGNAVALRRVPRQIPAPLRVAAHG